MVRLEDLQFDNTVLQQLPVDEGPNQPRPVRASIYAYVKPTPLHDPELVAASADALELLGLDPSEADRDEFAQAMCGNTVLPGSVTAAHCYAGYQFGYFSGQLGDGAAIYLGEVVHPANGARHELQLKGAGLTPFSRSADGRKVLRSSMREFLASEAMAGLGIPTTRAGSLVVSLTDRVVRDITYSGNPQLEHCAVVSRIAPTFIRFGSFEICKPTDPVTGRAGPSPGMSGQLLAPLVGFTIRSYFRSIWDFYGGGDDISMATMSEAQVLDMVSDWFTEVCRRTAHLVAGWQGVGFVHGVLNTDNLSITGLTLDYGPYGFMDRFDSRHVSNGSDDGARYTYAAQPAICKWNCERLAEALAGIPLPTAAAAAAAAGVAAGGDDGTAAGGAGGGSLLPPSRAKRGLQVYDDEVDGAYRAIFRRKLGLIGEAGAKAAAAAAAAGSSSSNGTASAAAPAGDPNLPPSGGADRPIWPISSSCSADVAAAAAAVAAAPLDVDAAVEDDSLIADLLALMEATGADFTNTFRRLSMVPMPLPNTSGTNAASTAAAGDAAVGDGTAGDGDFGGFLPLLLSELASPAELAAGSKAEMPLENVQMLMMLAGRDPAMLHALGITPAVLQQQLAAHKAAAKWSGTSAADKAAADEQQWRVWLKRYQQRLQQEANAGVPPELRAAVMTATNPRLVLRNWIAQAAIAAAEPSGKGSSSSSSTASGDYGPCRAVLQLLRDPFREDGEMELAVPPVAAVAAAASAGPKAAATAGAAQAGGGVCAVGPVKLRVDGKPPEWAAKLCVTCSS